MTSNKPTIRFDHQVFDFRLVFDVLKAWHDAMTTPLGGFSPALLPMR